LYNELWLHVSTIYMVILTPLVHTNPKLQLQILFLGQKKISGCRKMRIDKI